MRARDLGMLVLLAALWGASFLFIRVAVHVTGPVVLAFIRVALAAAGLALYAAVSRQRLALRGHWRAFLILAFGNAALPYILISASELHLTASLAAILNATTPLFAAALSVIWLREGLTARMVAGLVCGLGGVIVIAGWSPLPLDGALALSLAVSLLASFSYAVTGILAKRLSAGLPVLTLAFGQQVGASLLLLPLTAPIVATDPATLHLSPTIVLAILGLALLATSFAYILYFTLIANVGPTRTLGVTFLVPVFGLFWGALFLHEPIGPSTALGLLLILISVLFTSGLRLGPRVLPQASVERPH